MSGFLLQNTPLGRPGVGGTYTATPRQITFGNRIRQFPGGGIIDGVKSRDPGNTGQISLLRAGLLMGRVTSTGQYAPSVFGLTGGALAGSGTSLTLPEAVGDELVRRVGATGTFKLTGPPTAAGTVRQLTITYSAVAAASGGNRVVTITAPGVNQAEDVRLSPAATGGNIQLNVMKPDGTRVTTANIAWNATDATFLAAINSALDTATGVVGGIVATAIAATDTDLGFTLTYSGTGYAGQTWAEAEVALNPTSVVSWYVAPRTAAVNGAFVTASFIGDTDGSEVPQAFIEDGFGKNIDTNTNSDIEWPGLIEEADVDPTQLINWPADTSLRAWVLEKLNLYNKFYFSTQH